MSSRHFLLVLALFVSGCASSGLAEHHAPATAATSALGKGDFALAKQKAGDVLRTDPDNPEAAAVRALTRYERTMHQLSLDLRTVVIGGVAAGAFNHRYLRQALEQGEGELAKVDSDLTLAARDPNFALDLCVACWDLDWNGNGRVDERDRLLFQIEQDADGKPIPEDDPRRKPTFRFDRGDLYWARAFVAFQRAAIDLALAYEWEELDRVANAPHPEKLKLKIRLIHPERVKAARELILAGLDASKQSRQAYLAERDDEREWMPNPRQKNHPLPLPVDHALYDTWGDVLGDLERLVKGEEGLSLAELAKLDDDTRGLSPTGYLDLGHALSDPGDIVLDLSVLDKLERRGDFDAVARQVLGQSYKRSMRPSPLLGRLHRMKGEVDRGQESLERKLRYLIWIN